MLSTLSKPDLNKLGEMVISPYFNKNKDVTRLYELLYEAFPDFPKDLIDRNVVYPKIFEGDDLNEQRLRYVMTDLTKLVEQLFVEKELHEDTLLTNQLLLSALQDHGLTKLSPTVIEKSRNILESYPFHDQYRFNHQFLLERDYYEYVASKRNIAVTENLEQILKNLDYYFIVNKLKFAAELINHTNVMAGESDPFFLESIEKYMQQTDYLAEPAIEIYYLILKTLTHPDEETHYFNLKAKLAANLDKFPQQELNDMYIFARNYCAKRINSGDTKYLSEIFDLYKTLIENQIIYINGYLSQWDYKNIVSVGLRLEEYEWVHRFIEDYRSQIKPEERENAYTYNLAIYHYHLGEYDKTLELLRDVEFTDVYYHLDCKSLLMKTYFELEEFEPLHSLMDAFYAYLRRNKMISNYQRTSYSNFLSFVKKMIRYRYKGPEKIKKLEESLEDISPIPNLSWIQKKLEMLKTK